MTSHVVEITKAELALLDLLRAEPQLVENLRRAMYEQVHEREMHERLRRHLIRAVGAQRGAQSRTTRAD
jgi:hypothetical protein